MAPAASKADVAEQLGQAGSIPVRLRQLVARPGTTSPAGRPVAYFGNSLDPVQRELACYTSAVTNECFS